MAVATIDVKDATGVTRTINAVSDPGRAAAASSKPVALSTEDKASLDAVGTKLDTLHTDIGLLSQGWAFEVSLAPTVTNGAYSANDIVGGLLTFSNVARANDELFMITGACVICKAAVLPTWTLVLANANFGGSTVTDNSAFSLVTADALTVRKTFPIANLTDMGTPNFWSVDGLSVVMAPAAGTRNIFGLLIDGTGVTLTSTSDITIVLRGVGAK